MVKKDLVAVVILEKWVRLPKEVIFVRLFWRVGSQDEGTVCKYCSIENNKILIEILGGGRQKFRLCSTILIQFD